MQRIRDAAREHAICVVLGFSERSASDSLYIAQGIIAPSGELVVKRRKIKPTHMVSIPLIFHSTSRRVVGPALPRASV